MHRVLDIVYVLRINLRDSLDQYSFVSLRHSLPGVSYYNWLYSIHPHCWYWSALQSKSYRIYVILFTDTTVGIFLSFFYKIPPPLLYNNRTCHNISRNFPVVTGNRRSFRKENRLPDCMWTIRRISRYSHSADACYRSVFSPDTETVRMRLLDLAGLGLAQ